MNSSQHNISLASIFFYNDISIWSFPRGLPREKAACHGLEYMLPTPKWRRIRCSTPSMMRVGSLTYVVLPNSRDFYPLTGNICVREQFVAQKLGIYWIHHKSSHKVTLSSLLALSPILRGVSKTHCWKVGCQKQLVPTPHALGWSSLPTTWAKFFIQVVANNKIMSLLYKLSRVQAYTPKTLLVSNLAFEIIRNQNQRTLGKISNGNIKHQVHSTKAK